MKTVTAIGTERSTGESESDIAVVLDRGGSTAVADDGYVDPAAANTHDDQEDAVAAAGIGGGAR